ncbi:MAG: peptidoglycan editing factor PgeF [Woeseiaceae bacterium]|nr:peptidoglycan editing factor PgeF [Woeseiaceae bacterium]
MNSGWIRADWPAPAGIIAGTTLRDSEFELPAQPRRINQVHGAGVARWEMLAADDAPPDADAIVSATPGSLCVVRTADCLPVLLCSNDGGEIAAVHAGWRGLAAGVIEAAIAALATPPGNLIAWLGPAISQPAFEVGGEVRDAFLAGSAGAADAFEKNARGRWQADLYVLGEQRLQAAGVTAVSGGGLCTHADAGRFYSYRRDGSTGRMLSFVYKP